MCSCMVAYCVLYFLFIILLFTLSSPLDDGQELVTLGLKGCQGIEQASKLQGSSIITFPGQKVHTKCRHRHCNKRRIDQNSRKSQNISSVTPVSLRSEEKAFSFKENCLFCGKIDTFNSKTCRGHKLIPVRTLDFQETIVQQCKIMNNKWSEAVMARISSVHDLPAADAMYHQICSSNFRTGKSIPLVFTVYQMQMSSQPVSVED